MANIDVSPYTTIQAVLNYIAKYVTKAEKATQSFKGLARDILPKVSAHNPILSFAARFINKLIA